MTIILLSSIALAGEPIKTVALGSPMPTWSALPGADGKPHDAKELAEAKAVLIIFYDNICPDCEMYTPRINDLLRDAGKQQVATVLMNVTVGKENTIEKMAEMVKSRQLVGQYLLDITQKMGRQCGATMTPQAYLFDKDRKLVYVGAIDNHWDLKKVTRHHVRQAIAETLAGKKVEVPVTEAEGCFIEYEPN